MPKNHVLGVLKPAEHKSGFKKCYEANLRVFTSIFVKFSNSPSDLEIRFNGVFRYEELEYHNKKSYDVLLRVHASIFRNNTNLSQYLEIGSVGVLSMIVSMIVRVYMSIFHKKSSPYLTIRCVRI